MFRLPDPRNHAMTTPVWFHLLRTPPSFTNHELSFHHAVPVRSPCLSPYYTLTIHPLAISLLSYLFSDPANVDRCCNAEALSVLSRHAFSFAKPSIPFYISFKL